MNYSKPFNDRLGQLLGVTYINYAIGVHLVPGGYICLDGGVPCFIRRSHIDLINRWGIKGANRTMEYFYS